MGVLFVFPLQCFTFVKSKQAEGEYVTALLQQPFSRSLPSPYNLKRGCYLGGLLPCLFPSHPIPFQDDQDHNTSRKRKQKKITIRYTPHSSPLSASIVTSPDPALWSYSRTSFCYKINQVHTYRTTLTFRCYCLRRGPDSSALNIGFYRVAQSACS